MNAMIRIIRIIRTHAQLSAVISVLGAAPLFACSAFGGDDDGETDSNDATGSDTSSETGEIPDVGLRVYPRYLLQDLQAVVTIETDGDPILCPVDEDDGGYLCDTDSLGAQVALVRVERDGFDPSLRTVMVSPGQLEILDVHLAVEGGTTSVWSECVEPAVFGSCEDVCGAVDASCTPASCNTGDPEWPLASYQTFEAADCVEPAIESLVAGCAIPLPEGGDGVAGLRCCCSG